MPHKKENTSTIERDNALSPLSQEAKQLLANYESKDLELENIVGNLMIAQYQVDKLRMRLAERIGGYASTKNGKKSAIVFRALDKSFGVNINCIEDSTNTLSRLINDKEVEQKVNERTEQLQKVINDYQAELVGLKYALKSDNKAQVIADLQDKIHDLELDLKDAKENVEHECDDSCHENCYSEDYCDEQYHEGYREAKQEGEEKLEELKEELNTQINDLNAQLSNMRDERDQALREKKDLELKLKGQVKLNI